MLSQRLHLAFLFGERVFHLQEPDWIGKVIRDYNDMVAVKWPDGRTTYEKPRLLRRAP